MNMKVKFIVEEDGEVIVFWVDTIEKIKSLISHKREYENYGEIKGSDWWCQDKTINIDGQSMTLKQFFNII